MVQGFRAQIKYGLLNARSGPLYHLVFCLSPGIGTFFLAHFFHHSQVLHFRATKKNITRNHIIYKKNLENLERIQQTT
jgi:hypothetical protein